MPSAAPTLTPFFTPQVIARGEHYFRDGRVRLGATSPTHLDAVVRGSRPYRVTVTVHDDRIVTSCTCPYAEDFDTGCKHVWATILAAADAGTRLETRPTLVHGHPAAANGGRRDRGERHLVPKPDEHERHRGRHRGHDHEPARAETPRWRRELDRLRAERAAFSPFGELRSSDGATSATWPADRRIAYVVDTRNLRDAARLADGIVVELATQKRAAVGGWAAPRRFAYSHAEWLAVPDADDREVAQMLLGAREAAPWEVAADLAQPPKTGRRFHVRPPAYGTTLRRICATGRAFVRHGRTASARGDELAPLRWDDGPPWRVELALVPHGEHRLKLEAALVRDAEDGSASDTEQPRRVPVADVVLLAAGLAVVADPARPGSCLAARADDAGAKPLLDALADGRVIAAADTDAMALAAEIAALFPRLAPVTLPAALGVQVLRVAPVPLLSLRGTSSAEARLAFAYDDTVVEPDAPGGVVSQPDRRRILARDRAAESRAIARLEKAGARASYELGRTVHRLPRERVGRVAVELSAEGWRVTVDDRVLRRAGEMTASVRSGVDWFDLDAAVDFEGVQVALPALLAALRRGERTVALGDGSLGTLPDEWVARWGRLALLGAATPDGLRFAPGQAALLDALLAAMPAASTDAQFERARAALRRFDGFAPADAPAGFHGELRDYQREGLGWLEALREVGLGGILADDMGLGKTVQVLALLERLRQQGAGPSLVVVPASIVFNWVREAARFAPALRVHVHHGAARSTESAAIADADLVVTTYGTLRRDAAEFRDVQWEYAILDEAQAIKNATTATAKAARLLRARYRLAVTGTPVENRLEELWSLFEFLNPGMLGASSAFRRLVDDDGAGEGEGLELVARIVRPYILRRTKSQVARELPERVEQTVWVDLEPAERKAYDELRDHYRASLLGRVDAGGLSRNKIHVLEALLRLRQAACHRGLIDPARAGESSGKLDVLLARLAETTAEGHKTLVFSQFTTLLAIVRDRLDALGVRYEYLDGRTRDRQARVDRFQQDPDVPVFLVSLKAGGVGLNLTAADYVFLLDPWWNPAVEAQAIDRAHRIGQTRRVIASRLVARDTVEEKVLLLQDSKRALADAVVRADEGMLRTLTREDLELLLG